MKYGLFAAAVTVAGCATTSSTRCPPATRLIVEEPASGRVEACEKETGGDVALPAPPTAYHLGTASPPVADGFHGMYTHWYPDGAIESAGLYDEDGKRGGVWAFWKPDGSRKQLVRFVHGTEVPADPAEPLPARMWDYGEARSHPRANREQWGDISAQTLLDGHRFFVENPTQVAPNPTAPWAAQLAVRKRLPKLGGPFPYGYLGGELAYRASSSDDLSGYGANLVFAVGGPARFIRSVIPRLDHEIELQLGAEYFDVTARRSDMPGTKRIGFWAPRGGVRFALAFEVTPAFHLVAGFVLDGVLGRTIDEQVSYCAGICSAPVAEHWKLGGGDMVYDLGLRLLLR